MSRCIRKVENEDWCIVYCNTVDRVFPTMFKNYDTAKRFVDYFDNTNVSIYDKIEGWQGELDLETLNQFIEELEHDIR